MIANLDAYRAAKFLVYRSGTTASAQAARNAEEMWQTGDVDGWAAWVLIEQAADDLLLVRPATGEFLH